MFCTYIAWLCTEIYGKIFLTDRILSIQSLCNKLNWKDSVGSKFFANLRTQCTKTSLSTWDFQRTILTAVLILKRWTIGKIGEDKQTYTHARKSDENWSLTIDYGTFWPCTRESSDDVKKAFFQKWQMLTLWWRSDPEETSSATLQCSENKQNVLWGKVQNFAAIYSHYITSFLFIHGHSGIH